MIMDFLNQPSNEEETKDNTSDAINEEEPDLSEEALSALSQEMDAINSALDSLEQRNDLINSELRNILKENAKAKEEIEQINTSGEK